MLLEDIPHYTLFQFSTKENTYCKIPVDNIFPYPGSFDKQRYVFSLNSYSVYSIPDNTKVFPLEDQKWSLPSERIEVQNYNCFNSIDIKNVAFRHTGNKVDVLLFLERKES